MESKAGMEKTFRTHDLSLAASLVETGQDFIEVQQNKGSCLFIFSDSESLRMAVSQYLSGEIRVEPKHFLFGWKKLRTAISESMDKQGKS